VNFGNPRRGDASVAPAAPKAMGRILAYLTDLTYVLSTLAEGSLALRPAGVWVQRRYRSLANRYDALIEQWEPSYGLALEQALGYLFEGKTRILDTGTGTGYAARRLAQRFPEASIVGVDLSAEMLREARKKGDVLHHPRVIWIQANSAKLPFRDQAFDLAVVHNAPLDLEELRRVVRRGGEILLCLSSGAAIPQLLQRILRRRLHSLGCPVVHLGHAGEGLYLIARRA
jgi:ubiquinone/menaquinone biosynthesis C-methylase UbiE